MGMGIGICESHLKVLNEVMKVVRLRGEGGGA